MSTKAIARLNVDLMFRAFSDRTRLRILHLLLAGESCVGDIVTILSLDQPGVSRHLAYLRRAGLVASRKASTWNYYSLAPTSGEFHKKLLECLACCFAAVPQIQRDQKRAARLKGAGCCPGTEKKAEQKPWGGGCCAPEE